MLRVSSRRAPGWLQGVAILLLQWSALAEAAEPVLRTLDRAAVVGLAPLLEGGEAALIESKADGRLRQVTLFALVDAAPDVVLGVVADAERYGEFVAHIDEVKVLARQGRRSKVRWRMSTPLVTVGGVHAVVDARPDHIQYRAISGDLKRAVWRWEVAPLDGGRRCVAALYTYADLRDSHWLLEKLIDVRPDLEHSAVIAGNLVQLKGIATEAERRAGRRSGARRPSVRRWRPAKLRSVSPLLGGGAGASLRRLLRRGEVALVQSRPDGRLEQAVLVGAVDRPPAQVRKVVGQVERYPEFMPTVEEVVVRRRQGERVVYTTHYDIPLLAMQVETELKPVGRRRLSLKILGGDIKRGRYGWEFLPVDGGRGTLTLFHGNADIRSQGFLLRTLVDEEPYLEHGLNVGIQLVALRAVHQRVVAAP